MIDQAARRITDVPCYLDGVPDDPPDAYVVLYPDAGWLRAEKYAGGHTDYRDGFAAVCASNSLPGLKRLVEYVRDQLTGWIPDGDTSQGPLYETGQSPVLDDRVASRTMHSITITYTANRRRKRG